MKDLPVFSLVLTDSEMEENITKKARRRRIWAAYDHSDCAS